MAGFLSKLFGFGGGESASSGGGKERMERIGEYAVYATPMKEGAQWRLAGRIESEGTEGLLVRRFIRADLFSSQDDAIDTTFRKAKQIIDQQGASLFGDGAPDRQV
ncbi:MAG TPA: transcriptional activator HlyU [Rhizobiales bacterium]|nr:transcriptional activator HlyU [Hyphomicrobiales bacterium]